MEIAAGLEGEAGKNGIPFQWSKGIRPRDCAVRWGQTPPSWQDGMRLADCPGESRMSEHLMSGLGRGCWKPQPRGDGLSPWWETPGDGSRPYRAGHRASALLHSAKLASRLGACHASWIDFCPPTGRADPDHAQPARQAFRPTLCFASVVSENLFLESPHP